LGVSSCLLGRAVRYDGGHKRDPFVLDVLGPHVEFVPVCPEVELGLGTPRETLRLVRRGDEVRMIMADGRDHTAGMRRYAKRRAAELAREDLSGCILKKDSPSCGLEGVKVYSEPRDAARPGRVERTGRGLFAEALVARHPHLPVEDEGRLNDPRVRDHFIERVFAYRRLKTFFAGRWTMGGLVAFHTAQKLVLLAHSAAACRELGRLVAEGRTMPRHELRRRYMDGFMGALSKPATKKRHTDVLQHLAGHLATRLDAASKAELHRAIDDYRRGLVPRALPLTLVRRHVRALGVEHLAGQAYLAPHLAELGSGSGSGSGLA
jgi:uncharacterized protein YbbK (DUF523 family)/uncharacterized protein YbgA (DUF1722 family)